MYTLGKEADHKCPDGGAAKHFTFSSSVNNVK